MGCNPVVSHLTTPLMQDWSKIDTSAMERDWEEGDDEAELKNSFEALQEMERRKMADMPQFDEKNPKAYLE